MKDSHLFYKPLQGSEGVFTRSGLNHLIPVINVVGNTTLARQKYPTDIAPLKTLCSFCRGRAVLPTTFMTGNKWLISDRVNAPCIRLGSYYNLTSALAKHNCSLLDQLVYCKYTCVMRSFERVYCTINGDGPVTSTCILAIANSR